MPRDPSYNTDIQKLGKIQRRAARWVMKDYNRHSSVTAMLKQLSWPELQTQRRLQTLYNHLIALSVPSYYICLEN